MSNGSIRENRVLNLVINFHGVRFFVLNLIENLYESRILIENIVAFLWRENVGKFKKLQASVRIAIFNSDKGHSCMIN